MVQATLSGRTYEAVLNNDKITILLPPNVLASKTNLTKDEEDNMLTSLIGLVEYFYRDYNFAKDDEDKMSDSLDNLNDRFHGQEVAND